MANTPEHQQIIDRLKERHPPVGNFAQANHHMNSWEVLEMINDQYPFALEITEVYGLMQAAGYVQDLIPGTNRMVWLMG